MHRHIRNWFASLALPCALALTQAQAYTHPGAPLTLSDLQTLKANVDSNREPWKSGYAALAGDSRSSLNYTMQGPFANVSRSPNVNLNQWRSDMNAIWNLSRMWYFTGNEAYAQKAHDILLAWANNQTSFTGGESMLDLGDYAYKFVGGADILRGTWPGWTAADTTAVKAYFGDVLMPASNPYGESMYGAANKGALALVSLGLLAIFNDDTAKLDQVVYQVRSLAHIGLRNSNDIGLLGDSLRDQGHAHGQLFSLAMLAEALWKQGIDVYADSNNRLLAAGEYFARVNDLAPTPFLPFGTTDNYYIGDWTNRGWGGGHIALNLIHGAYVVRKGLPAPYTNLRRQELPVNGDSFMFLKEADPSAATPGAALPIPATTSITSGFSNAEIGGATPVGGASYSGGTWTVQGGGSEMWGTTNDSCHFTYQALTGDCSIIAKVESVQNTSLSAKAGVMMRTGLEQGAPRAWMAVTPRVQFEQNIQGLAVYGGTNYSNKAYNIPGPTASYWVKLERLGNIVTGYVSPDGTNWAATDVGRFNGTPPTTLYVGLVVCSVANGTLNTSTFSNVQITGGNGGAPVITPAAPVALLAAPGENVVPLRWQPSFGATSYTVKRATSSGGPYSNVATGITASSYTDTTVTNGTTYYYIVTATNSAGTSANSPEDSATPVSPLVNIAFGGAANDSANNPNGTQGAGKAFDLTPGSKWLSSAVSWLQYDFGAGNAQTIKRYTVTSANDVPARDPKDWQFQGSNDGSAWTTLDTRSNQSFATRFEAQTFSIASSGAYRYYRLNVTANGGDGSTQLSELGLLTDVGRTIPDGTYSVLSRRSNKALDVLNGGTADGTDTVQWGWNGGNNQKWTLTHLGNGQYQASGVASGKLLEVSGASTSNGAIVQIWPSNNHNCQKWTVTPAGNGAFKFLNVHSGKAVDVSGGSTADGAAIIQWPYNGATNQQWLLGAQ
jgi:regulation of enolase protein 1 (concanavalin A-like superfamily)